MEQRSGRSRDQARRPRCTGRVPAPRSSVPWPLARFVVVVLLLWSSPAGVGSARASLVLNEILYDPDGSDTGREWVEILNTGPWPAPAEGLALEFANGAEPGTWAVVWQGRDTEWIEPGAFFLVGERPDGAVDSPTRLGLQNGPDALRLVREGFILDLVGWGEPLDPSLFEGAAPALPARSGESLVRTDGLDTDDNRTDFLIRSPTPGRANFPRVDLAVSLLPEGGRALPVDRSSPRVRVQIVVENRGRETATLARADCTVAGNRVVLPGDSLEAGARASQLAVVLGMASGEDAVVSAHVHLPGDEDPGNDADTLTVALTPSALRITEIYPRPLPSDAEWIELEAQSTVRLAGWRVEDAAGGSVRIVPADSLTAGLFVLSPAGGKGTIGSEGWPTLNDRASVDGIADTLFLIDPVDRIRDWAVYGEAAPGVSWIRLEGPPLANPRDLWSADPARPGGTPGFAPRGDVGTSLWPLSRGVSLVAFPAGVWIDLPPDTRAYSFDVYDLRGRRVWSSSGPVRGERIRWDARDPGGRQLLGGVYLLDLLAETPTGLQREQRTVVLDR